MILNHIKFIIFILILNSSVDLCTGRQLFQCEINQWKCLKHNQCIDLVRFCDGIEHCLDATDENSPECLKLTGTNQTDSYRIKRQSSINEGYYKQNVNKDCRIPRTQNMRIYDNDNADYIDNSTALRIGQVMNDGSTVFLRCPHGYDVAGDNNFNICIDGEWLHPFTFCQIRSGCKVEHFENGIVSYANALVGFKVGDIVGDTLSVTYICANDYQLIGSPDNICLDDVWVKRHPICQKIEPIYGCRIEQMPNIRIIYKFGAEIQYQNAIIDDAATITYACHSGHILHGVAENICVGEDWLSPHPVCEKFGSGCRIQSSSNLMVLRKADSKVLQAGEYVANFIDVQYKCDKNHFSTGSLENFCTNDTWENEPPICEKYCPEQDLQSHMFTATCWLHGLQVKCKNVIRTGVRAITTCNEGYKELGGVLYNDMICENGKWLNKPRNCVPDCGGEFKETTKFITDGIESKTIIPWHVGIYYVKPDEKYELQCGGTIISSNIIISAAHCFWDTTNRRANDKALYRIAAGKLRRHYNDDTDIYVQKFTIQELHIPSRFDIQIFFNDICVVVLNQRVVFNVHVKPACLDWNLIKSPAQYSGRTGFLAGWGITETGDPSNILNTAKMKALSRDDCLNKKKWSVAEDQFCAGDGSISACKGDSGGGLTVINPQRQFTIWGIVSFGDFGLVSKTCFGEYRSSYTDVLQHRPFIYPILEQYSPEIISYVN